MQYWDKFGFWCHPTLNLVLSSESHSCHHVEQIMSPQLDARSLRRHTTLTCKADANQPVLQDDLFLLSPWFCALFERLVSGLMNNLQAEKLQFIALLCGSVWT